MNIVFLAPWWFGMLPVFGAALFYIYKNRGSLNQRKVSSTLLLSEFRRTPNAKALPFVPWRLILELLLFFLITFALSRFIAPTQLQKILIVLDLSFSTLSRDAGGQTVSSRLKSELLEYLDKFDEQQTFNIQIADGSGLQQNLVKDQIKQIVYNASNQYADNLQNILQNSSIVSDYDEIFLVTDRVVEQIALPSKIKIPTLLTPFANNLFFSDIRVEQNDNKLILTGRILKSDKFDRLKLPLKVSVSLEASQIKPSENISVEVKDNEPTVFRIPLTSNNYQKIQITGADPSIDTILEDSIFDIGNLVQNTNQKILVKNIDISRLNIPNITYLPKFVSDNTDNNKSPIIGEIVFSDQIQQVIQESTGNLLIQNSDFRSAKTQAATEWNSDSALLTYVSFDKERTFSFVPISCPEWMIVDLKINQLPALCSGIFEGKRVVYAGLSLLPMSTRVPTISNIIALNALKWTFLDSNTKENTLEIESALGQPIIDKFTTAQSRVLQDVQSEKSHIPFKWFTVCIAFILLADSIWWIRKSRVWGR